MSWECVRDLEAMHRTLLLIHNITSQNETPESVREWIEEVHQILDETIGAVRTGRVK